MENDEYNMKNIFDKNKKLRGINSSRKQNEAIPADQMASANRHRYQ
jgi:hypothetical protein